MIKLSPDIIFDGNGNSFSNHVLVLDNTGTIEGIIPKDEAGEEVKEIKGALCPGFINAHCHLELSHLKGKIPKHGGLPNFIQEVQQVRKSSMEEKLEAMRKAEEEMISSGIVAVGDISNSTDSLEIKKRGKLRYHTFVESFSFDEEKADAAFFYSNSVLNTFRQEGLRASLVPHAPYSLSDKLFEKVASTFSSVTLITMHNQETLSENEMFEKKSGDLLKSIAKFGNNISDWKASSKSSLKTVAHYFGGNIPLLLVHNTFTKEDDIDCINELNSQTHWCFCPGANLYIENTLPDVNLFLKQNQNILLGTDSLASNDSLSILEEMKKVQLAFPEIETKELIKWACSNGATFFGYSDLGSFEKGKRPGVNVLGNISKLGKISAEAFAKSTGY